jgi:hypothetical protein
VPSFFRSVLTNPPTRADFLSYVDLGLAYDDGTPEAREMARGVSVYATLPQARRRARSRGEPFVAEMHVPDGGPIAFRRTGSGRGHYTLWGDADALLASVMAVHPTDPPD